jgi:hypothetical protein
VPWHIDQRKMIVAQDQRGESKVNSDAALFLCGQAIGVNTCQDAY